MTGMPAGAVGMAAWWTDAWLKVVKPAL